MPGRRESEIISGLDNVDHMLIYEKAQKELGDGPMRFAPIDEKTTAEQIAALSEEEKACFDELKERWNKKDRGHKYSDAMILRFARCSPGPKKFAVEPAFKVMKNFNPRYLELHAEKLEDQLLSKTLFVLPHLKSNEGHDVFYMKPARYWPKKTSTELIIDNLVYCMESMVEKQKSCEEGIAFVANMNDWSFSNFSVSYCSQFMMTLQGRVPVRVRMFLIVNPPSWFGKIWSIMKPMLSADFRKKVHIIPESDLPNFLAGDFEKDLPDDFECGGADTEGLVKDYVAYRKYIEAAKSNGN